MKKLALVLTFVFSAAMIAPAFAADPVKTKAEVKKECPKDGKACPNGNKPCCNKDAKTCPKMGTSAPVKK